MRNNSRNHSLEATARAREARQNPSVAEEIVWKFLRGNRTGFHFRREVNVFSYRVDFYCAEASLAVELDGEQHDPARDALRDAELAKAGIEVLRIPNVRFFQLDSKDAEDPIKQMVIRCEERSGRKAEDAPVRRSRWPSDPLP